MRRVPRSLTFVLVALAWCGAVPRARAGALAVAPVLIEVVAQAQAATSVTVSNRGTAPVNIQARVMRWTQEAGKDVLQPTADVVVSPGIARVAPGQEQLVRVVRTSTAPIEGEEAYRLLVDELPSPATRASGNVTLVVRQALAVFFRSPAAESRPLDFAVQPARSGAMLRASNHGQVHYRLTELAVHEAGGRLALSQPGLAGYVIGGASYAWPLHGAGAGVKHVTGRSNLGPIDMAVAAR